MRIRTIWSALWVALAAMVWAMGGCASGAGGWGSGGVGAPYPPEPMREYRGMWVATVDNIDWPSKPGLSADEMRAEMMKVLETAARLNLNAIFLQVRPSCDAIYPSDLEPWSEYLTGTQGTGPGFDPLAEWVAGAHARGIELHAWFNPFRARQAGAKSASASTHVSVAHPELVREYGKMQWLDPGEPEAREHTLRVILDVVSRYDVDGVHFDDYFYPYPQKDLPFPDSTSYAKYRSGGGRLALADWRRDNINSLVRTVYEQVHRVRPHVRVGVSPFGIWRPDYPKGIKGFDAFEGLAADSLRWLAAGWVDYLAPQLYWKIDSAQAFPQLLDWWVACSMQSQRRPILVGNFTSRLSDKPDDAKSWGAPEILNQITRTRDRAALGAAGNIHFSAVALMQNRRGIADALAQGPYAEAALPVEMPWLARGTRPGSPHVDLPAESDQNVVVRWQSSGRRDPEPTARWLVWARYGGHWTMRVLGNAEHVALARQSAAGELERVAVAEVDEGSRVGSLRLLRITPVTMQTADAAIVGP